MSETSLIPFYDMNQFSIRWEKQQRYYLAHVFIDLLGDWSVTCTWGGKGSKLGNSRIYAFHEENAMRDFVEGIKKRRAFRGYKRLY
jgi:hypothetical protein